MIVAKQGGTVAREELESCTSKKVVSLINAKKVLGSEDDKPQDAK